MSAWSEFRCNELSESSECGGGRQGVREERESDHRLWAWRTEVSCSEPRAAQVAAGSGVLPQLDFVFDCE